MSSSLLIYQRVIYLPYSVVTYIAVQLCNNVFSEENVWCTSYNTTAVQNCAVYHISVQCSIVQPISTYNAVMHSTIYYYTLQYDTVKPYHIAKQRSTYLVYSSFSRAPLLGARRCALRTPPERAYTHL